MKMGEQKLGASSVRGVEPGSLGAASPWGISTEREPHHTGRELIPSKQ